MKKTFAVFWLAFVLLALASNLVLAQGSGLQLTLSKNWGFALGGQIQGLFTIGVSGPADITSVTYQIDGAEMSTQNKAPFTYSFNTSDYALGRHQLTAIARTGSGQTLKSNSMDVEMVTSSAGWQSTGRMLLPIFGIILLAVLVSFGVQFLPIGGRHQHYEPGEERNYGLGGGAICSRCNRPFALPILSPHLLTSKLARCPYCGKWGLVRPASLDALRAAERAEVQAAAPTVHELSPEEQLRQQIEDSKLTR